MRRRGQKVRTGATIVLTIMHGARLAVRRKLYRSPPWAHLVRTTKTTKTTPARRRGQKVRIGAIIGLTIMHGARLAVRRKWYRPSPPRSPTYKGWVVPEGGLGAPGTRAP